MGVRVSMPICFVLLLLLNIWSTYQQAFDIPPGFANLYDDYFDLFDDDDGTTTTTTTTTVTSSTTSKIICEDKKKTFCEKKGPQVCKRRKKWKCRKTCGLCGKNGQCNPKGICKKITTRKCKNS